MNSDQIGGIVRTVLAAAGGYVIAKGWLDAATFTAISGAVVTIAVALWSWRTNKPGTVIAATP